MISLSKDLYGQMEELIPTCAALVESDLHIVWANRLLSEVVGFSIEELLTLRLLDLLQPEDIDTLLLQFERVLRREVEMLLVEVHFLRKNGETGWVRLRGRRLAGPDDGDKGKVLVLVKDITEYKESEELYRRHLACLEAIIDESPLAYQSLDPQGRILAVNSRWLTSLGYAREEVLGRWFGDFLAPGYGGVFAEHFLRFQSTGVARDVEFEMLRKDGLPLRASFFSRIEHDARQRMLRTHCFWVDISEARYRKLVEGTDDLVTVVDGSGRVLFVNHRAEAFFGLSAADCIGLSAFDFIHPDDHERTRTEFAGWVREGRDNIIFENRQVSRTGAIRYVHWTINLLYDAQQKQMREMVSFGKDISALKQAEAELAESRARYKSLVVNLPAGVALHDAKGIIWAWNKAAEEIFGLSASEIIGRNFWERDWMMYREDGTVWPPAEYPSALSLRTGQPFRDQLMKLKRPDGVELWLSVSTVPRFEAGQSRPGKVLAFIQDVTAARQAEEFKQHVERVIRHDIKSPLASTVQALDVFDEVPKGELYEELLAGMKENLRKVITLVDATESIAKMEMSSYDPEITFFDLRQLLRRVEHTLQPWIESKELRLEYLVNGAPAYLFSSLPLGGEERLIENMLVNLVKNALEASPREAVVRVELRDAEGRREIAIHNEGAVPEVVREHFFDKYVSFGKGRAGTGLGTYSARLIARAHGGDISMESSEATGTTVTVRLPLV